MSVKEQRIALNEAIFREVNEKISRFPRSPYDTHGPIGFVCECGDADCHEALHLRVDAYEQVRSDPNLFFVAADHADKDAERVVERHDGYWVVEKIREGREIAQNTDPRST